MEYISFSPTSEGTKITLVETKTNAPNPSIIAEISDEEKEEKKKKFDKFKRDVTEKFIHNLTILHNTALVRLSEIVEECKAIPNCCQFANESYNVYLVVKNHKDIWCVGLENVLRKELRAFL